MYVLPLLVLMLVALGISLTKNGIGSFVTLGILGAAIYTVPALIGIQASLATVSSAHRGYVPVPTQSQFVVLMAWLGLMVGLFASIFVFPKRPDAAQLGVSDRDIRFVAIASAVLGMMGFFYFAYAQGAFFYLRERVDQDVGAAWLLWRWTPLVGIVASAYTAQRKVLLVNVFVLFIIFLTGDRTLVAIATAALIAVASERRPGWWKRLKPIQVTGFGIGALVVFFGKSAYLVMKSGFSGQGWSMLRLSFKDQFLFQFEPLGTFSHLSYVMTVGLKIPPGEFLASVFGNLLLVPSAFGISTNVYNATVTETLSPKLGYGVAGNFMAHGYTVGSTAGAVFFYFLLPLIFTLCDRQFHTRTGVTKIFWCTIGAVFAFYIHRNGMDNQLSFVRQLFIVCVGTGLIALAFRQLAGGGPAVPARGFQIRRRPRDDEFALHGPGTKG